MAKKKLLIVNNNMRIGGIQKALLNLLVHAKDTYDITLLLFKKHGELLDLIPEEVTVIEDSSAYRYLGMSQAECKTCKDKLLRGGFAFLAKVFGFKVSAAVLSLVFRHRLTEQYDVAISYQQCAAPKSFYGGVAEYVLKHTNADKKICYVHCDYQNSGTACKYNNSIYLKFDKIACVSHSVRDRFLAVLPEMEDRCVVAPNIVDCQEIVAASEKDPYKYDPSFLNLLTVARLSPEKGIERFIGALADAALPHARYYVVGEGRSRAEIEQVIADRGLGDRVFLLGADVNPYRYMKNADALVLPSYHEAAPVVFQEAKVLGLPILATETTSAREMIPPECGYVCVNSGEGILELLEAVCGSPDAFRNKKDYHYDSKTEIESFLCGLDSFIN